MGSQSLIPRGTDVSLWVSVLRKEELPGIILSCEFDSLRTSLLPLTDRYCYMDMYRLCLGDSNGAR
jgi:hypothetical protein